MTTHEFDRQLKQALSDAIREDWAAVEAMGPALDFAPSPAYRRRVRRILSNHKAAIKRSARPRWKRLLTSAACLLLVCSISMAGIFTISPEARAWGLGLLRQWFPAYTDYVFSTAQESEAIAWQPSYLPEGYTLVSTFAPAPGSGTLTYEDEFGHYIDFTYQMAEEGMGFGVDHEHAILTPVLVNESPADLYTSNTSGWPHHLIWSLPDETVAFHLMADELEPGEFIQMAVTVEKIK